MENKISVVINTYNAQKYLSEVLYTVKDFDEIVVCDMESTDDTVKIANEYGCKVIIFPKKNYNICEVARDYAIHHASNEWVLVVDADELIPTELRKYLYDFIRNSEDVKGLFIPRRNYTMKVPLPASYPDYQLRFFNQKVTTWPPVIHTKPIVDGKVANLPKSMKECAIEHLDDSTWSTISKLNTYSDNEVSKRIGTKVTLCKLILLPTVRFIKQYIFKGGIFYGVAGYVQAMRSAIYKFTVLCKLYEKQIGL